MISVYSEPESFDSHRIRFLLTTKNISCKIINVDRNYPPEDLMQNNPELEIPALIDRDMHIYGVHVISEYLDERYPHPPLMPPDPMTRARLRFTVYRLEKDWFSSVHAIENAVGEKKKQAIDTLTHQLMAADSLFASNKYFLHDEMSIVDTNLIPFLWRLEHFGLDWEALPKSLRNYAHRIFQSKAFRKSITEQEREYRFYL